MAEYHLSNFNLLIKKVHTLLETLSDLQQKQEELGRKVEEYSGGNSAEDHLKRISELEAENGELKKENKTLKEREKLIKNKVERLAVKLEKIEL